MSNPLALMITDTHLELSNIDLIKDIFQQLIDEAKSLGVSKAYHLGDIFNSRKSQHFQVLKAWNDILDNLHSNSIELVAIPGNHDKLDYTSESSYLDIYSEHPALTIYTSIYDEDVVEGVRFHFLPYFEEKETYPQLHSQANILEGGRNYMFTHVAYSGAQNNDGSVVENELTETSQFDKVFVGHYHNANQVGNNIFFIGSAYQRNHGEDDLKGFTVLYEDGSHEQILTEFPRFIKIKIDVDVIDTKQIGELKTQYTNSEDHIRFEFVGDKEKVAKIDKSEFEALGIDVKKKFIDVKVDVTQEQADTFTGFDKQTILDEFEEFCYTSDNIPDEKRDEIHDHGLINYLQKHL